jgi:hypothetical protein
MGYYRLYFLDAFHGRIDRFIQFELESDETAIDFAQEWQGSLTLELCNGARVVKHWDPVAPSLNRRRPDTAALGSRGSPR